MHGRQEIRLFLFGIIGAAGVLVAPGDVARAGAERLSLPFSCRAGTDDIQLSPSGEQSLKIVGPRQERVVLACAEGRPVQCRTMIAHRFDIMCGDRQVSWDRVAEAIGGRRASRVWREGAQLNIALLETAGSAAAVAARVPCAATPEGSPAESEAVQLEQIALKPCPAPSARELRFVMPAGFAPVAHFGARIEPAAGPVGKNAAAQSSRSEAVAAAAPAESSGPAAQQKLLERTILSEPLPELGGVATPERKGALGDQVSRSQSGPSARAGDAAGSLASPPDAAAVDTGSIRSEGAEGIGRIKANAPDRAASPPILSAWTATVKPSPPEAFGAAPSHAAIASVAPASTSYRDGLLWLVLTSLFVTSGWAMWRRPAAMSGLAGRLSGGMSNWASPLTGGGIAGWGIMRRLSSVLGSSDRSAHGAGHDAVGFPAAGLDAAYESVAGIVEALPKELPLRSVLDDEMRRVRQRLCVAKASGASDTGAIPAPAYRVLMRDLERIRRIGVSARDSVIGGGVSSGAAPGNGRLPTTRAEAFAVLGLNPSVSEATIKKCVDALRMSWHPDLAHDAADQAVREERIKQINAAVDLIARRVQPA